MSYNLPPAFGDQPDSPPERIAPLTPVHFYAENERPVGVTVVAVLNFLGALLGILILTFVMLQPAAPPPEKTNVGTEDFPLMVDVPSSQSYLTGTYNFLACTSVIQIVAGLALGMGLWRLRPWARTASIWLYSIGLVASICLNFSRPLTGSALLGLVISGGILYYFARPEIARAFEPPMY